MEPRTKPGCFEGNGEKALPWLKRVKDETGMLIATEVATPEHVELALKYDIDILWIGARTTTNPFAIQALSDLLCGVKNIPVLVKNPVNPDLELWIGALQRFESGRYKNDWALFIVAFRVTKRKYTATYQCGNFPSSCTAAYPTCQLFATPAT